MFPKWVALWLFLEESTRELTQRESWCCPAGSSALCREGNKQKLLISSEVTLEGCRLTRWDDSKSLFFSKLLVKGDSRGKNWTDRSFVPNNQPEPRSELWLLYCQTQGKSEQSSNFVANTHQHNEQSKHLWYNSASLRGRLQSRARSFQLPFWIISPCKMPRPRQVHVYLSAQTI